MQKGISKELGPLSWQIRAETNETACVTNWHLLGIACLQKNQEPARKGTDAAWSPTGLGPKGELTRGALLSRKGQDLVSISYRVSLPCSAPYIMKPVGTWYIWVLSFPVRLVEISWRVQTLPGSRLVPDTVWSRSLSLLGNHANNRWLIRIPPFSPLHCSQDFSYSEYLCTVAQGEKESTLEEYLAKLLLYHIL